MHNKSMKISESHYNTMSQKFHAYFSHKALIREKTVAQWLEHYITNNLGINPETRFCWDVTHAALDIKWLCDELYYYLNDNHIETAAKDIIADMTK